MNVLIAYATYHGLSRRVAERLAARVRSLGRTAELVDLTQPGPESLAHDAVVLVGAVHFGKLHPKLVAFARQHHVALTERRAMLLPVSMSAAGLAPGALPLDIQRVKQAALFEMLDHFTRETAWLPKRVHQVAGGLPYRRYGFLLRLVMRAISKRSGASTDTSRDHEYTDWAGIDACADELCAGLPSVATPANPVERHP
jgi:menaquinone-dependent protoporphyrinogen oxidase